MASAFTLGSAAKAWKRRDGSATLQKGFQRTFSPAEARIPVRAFYAFEILQGGWWPPPGLAGRFL